MTSIEKNSYEWLDASELMPEYSQKKEVFKQLDFLKDMFDE